MQSAWFYIFCKLSRMPASSVKNKANILPLLNSDYWLCRMITALWFWQNPCMNASTGKFGGKKPMNVQYGA
jgi:hypothetical protein